MKLFILIIVVVFMAGCGPTSNDIHEKENIAIKNEAHGYVEYYTTERLSSLQESGNKFAIFVSAEWCPACKVLSEEMIKNQDIIPEKTVILIADFDTNIELKEEYKVIVKHTGIFFGADGKHQNTMARVDMEDFIAHLSP